MQLMTLLPNGEDRTSDLEVKISVTESVRWPVPTFCLPQVSRFFFFTEVKLEGGCSSLKSTYIHWVTVNSKCNAAWYIVSMLYQGLDAQVIALTPLRLPHMTCTQSETYKERERKRAEERELKTKQESFLLTSAL